MNVVLIMPTGLGLELGGHAGDGNPVAKLLASTCDNLITHPNVVNASDINEMTDNTLYVEGSMLDRFLEGEIELQKVKSNKVLVVFNSPIKDENVNAVNAARATIGLDAEILTLSTPLQMIAKIVDGKATGDVVGWEALIKQVKKYDFDALAISTPITVEKEIAVQYLEKDMGVNPWGGVEAVLSKLVGKALNKPVAHAPIEAEWVEKDAYTPPVVDPRKAAEVVSTCYIHCVLKGLHKAPRIGKGLSYRDIDVMVSPDNCWGRAHEACNKKSEIPIIAVRNSNYLEAAGILLAMKEGISLESLRRPLKSVRIHNENKK